jgi:hypothetical protein
MTFGIAIEFSILNGADRNGAGMQPDRAIAETEVRLQERNHRRLEASV